MGTDSDPSVGNRGSILWVEDAGYNDPSSPSYQKQYLYSYDQYGRKASETNLNNVVTEYTYGTNGDPFGYLTQVAQDYGDSTHLNRTTQMYYDTAGHVVESVDPGSLQSDFYYNTLGQPTSAVFPANGSVGGETISYNYGANGRTSSVADNRGATSIAYEAGSDRVSSVTDPGNGTVGYTYLISGARLSMSLAGGGTWNYTYSQPHFLSCVPKDDPNSLTQLLSSMTDDAGRRLDVVLDMDGNLQSVESNETYSNGNLQSCQIATYADDIYNSGVNTDGLLNTLTTSF